MYGRNKIPLHTWTCHKAIGELLVYRFLKNTLATKIKQLTPLSHHLQIAIATIASSYHRPSN